MNKPIKHALIPVFFFVLVGVVYVGYGIWRTAFKGTTEAYAAWDCASLVVEYMDTHSGRWPQSWEDLFSAARTLPHGDRALRGHSIENLQRISQLVRVDWDADPQKLAQATLEGKRIPFSVISRSDGSPFPMVWQGAEPNTLVWEYLKQKTPNN